MNRQFEMDYGRDQLRRYADKLKDLNQRLGSVDVNPLTRGEILDAHRDLAESIAEMRLVAQDLATWSKSEPRKKKFWQFWK
jgi:hypothetical protein